MKDVSRLRGPAAQAQLLYEETEDSHAQRHKAAIAQLKLERPPEFDRAGAADRRETGGPFHASPSAAGSLAPVRRSNPS